MMTERVLRAPSRALMVVVAACLLALIAPPGHRAEGAPCDGSRWVLNSLNVETKWNKKTYRAGTKAKVSVTVTRPGPYDPAGNGVPIDSPVHLPAPEVTVSTSLLARWPFPWDRDVTDEDGRVDLTVKIPKSWKGKVPAPTLALKIYNEGGVACSDIEEVGERYDFVTIKR